MLGQLNLFCLISVSGIPAPPVCCCRGRFHEIFLWARHVLHVWNSHHQFQSIFAVLLIELLGRYMGQGAHIKHFARWTKGGDSGLGPHTMTTWPTPTHTHTHTLHMFFFLKIILTWEMLFLGGFCLSSFLHIHIISVKKIHVFTCEFLIFIY